MTDQANYILDRPTCLNKILQLFPGFFSVQRHFLIGQGKYLLRYLLHFKAIYLVRMFDECFPLKNSQIVMFIFVSMKTATTGQRKHYEILFILLYHTYQSFLL